MADSNRKAELLLVIKEAGAKETAAEIQKLATTTATVQKELTKIARTDQIQRIGTEMGLLAKKTRDTAAAAKELSNQLQSIGANKDEIASATSAFNAAQTGGTNKLARFGSEIRNLPSTQIPGLGIGTDAIGNFLRLGGALTALSERVSVTSKLAEKLAPVLGNAGAGFAAIGIQAAPFLIAAAAIGLAIKSLSDEAQKGADAINKNVDAQRAANEEIVAGLTSEETRKKLEDLAEARKLEQAVLDQTTAAYAQFEKEAQAAVDSGKDLAGSLTDVIFGQGATVAGAKAVRADEDALYQQREISLANLAKLDAQTADYNILLESGALAANDAAEAEKKLAEERSKAALNSADSAAKELQAQQKALNATEDQNKKRLETIEEERAVAEKQIEVLTASGVTSEEVTNKIAALNDQLGLLGKESEFIKDTALEASRAADAEKKAVKDAEDAQKKAEQAQETYTKAVQSATNAYKQSTEDIGIRLRYAFIDNAEKTNRDLADIAKKYDRDQQDIALKARRSELEAYQDNLDDLANIRKDAAKDEQEALIDGDFKELYLSRQARDEALQEEEQADLKEAQKRKQNQDYALEDLRRNNERQRSDRLLGYERQNMDARAAQNRELQQATLTRNRALQVAAEGQNANLKQFANFWQQMNAIQQQGISNALKMTGASTQGASAKSPFGSFQSQFKAVVSR